MIQLVRLLIQSFPERWRPWAMRLWLEQAAAKEPKEALRELFAVEDLAAKQIDNCALKLDGGTHAKHRLTKYHDFFVERLRPDETVLDIGCGIGAVARSMAERAGARVTGIDFSEANIAAARARNSHERINYVLGDATANPPDGKFETIVISNVLEHIEHRVPFLRAIQSRYSPRRWLIRVPMVDRHWHVPLRRELGLAHFGDPTHFTEYTRESFETELAEAGLAARELIVNWGEIWAEAGPRAA